MSGLLDLDFQFRAHNILTPVRDGSVQYMTGGCHTVFFVQAAVRKSIVFLVERGEATKNI